MLYRLWEEGVVASLDDPLERYASTFSINNPLGTAQGPEPQGPVGEFEEMGSLPRPSPVTLRRMASQLSGEPPDSPAEGRGGRHGTQLPMAIFPTHRPWGGGQGRKS